RWCRALRRARSSIRPPKTLVLRTCVRPSIASSSHTGGAENAPLGRETLKSEKVKKKNFQKTPPTKNEKKLAEMVSPICRSVAPRHSVECQWLRRQEMRWRG